MEWRRVQMDQEMILQIHQPVLLKKTQSQLQDAT